MPKSKRAKVVHLSKVEKKGKALSQKIYDGTREAAEKFPYIFVLSVENMRTVYLQEVRSEFADSRIIFGRKKILATSLGLTPSTSILPNISDLTAQIRDSDGLLLFTPRSPSAVLSFFSTYTRTSFLRSGTLAPSTFTIPAGVVYSRGGSIPVEDDAPLQHSTEPMLRQWGVPTRLEKGKVMLDQEHVVCREGETVDAKQAAVLKVFGVPLAEFRVRVKAYYNATTTEVTVLDKDDTGEKMEG